MRGVTARRERRAVKSGSSPVRKKRERGAEASGKVRRAGALSCESGTDMKRGESRIGTVATKKAPMKSGLKYGANNRV